jgi:hypothetical protein
LSFVATIKTTALILFEDGRPDNEHLARSIAERLDPERFQHTVSPASKVKIPELLAAGLFFFGAETVNSAAYGEVARLFKGMNLAGRKAAFFGASGATIAWLKGLCADTDIAAAHADMVGLRPEPSTLAVWLRGIVQ